MAVLTKGARAGLLSVAPVASLLADDPYAGTAYACSCAGVPAVERQFAEADAVFAGEMVRGGIEDPTPKDDTMVGGIEFRVHGAWKGVVSGGSAVAYGQDATYYGELIGDETHVASSCAYPFEEGERYLVYAFRYEDGFRVEGCGRTASLANTEEDLRALGPASGRLTETGGPPLPAVGGLLLAALGSLSLLAIFAVGSLFGRARPETPERSIALQKVWPYFLVLTLAGNLVLAGGPLAGGAYACSCAETPSTDEALRESDAVFSGEVVDIGELPPQPAGATTLTMPYLDPVTFSVNGVWKGVSGESVTVHGQGPGPSCGLNFEQGETYLVFAYRTGEGEDRPLQTDLCSATRQTGEETARQMLGPPVDSLPDTGGVPPDTAQRDVGSTYAAAAILALLAAGAVLASRAARGPGR